MNDQKKIDRTRRNLLVATSVVGGAASVCAAAPFVASMWPSERAKAPRAPVDVDLSRVGPGELAVIERRAQPPRADHRSPAPPGSLNAPEPQVTQPPSHAPQPPPYATN